MDRRKFIGTVAGGVLAVPLMVHAQQPPKVARIGLLTTASPGSREYPAIDDIRQGLRERGYVEGRNIVIEARSADGKVERFPALASELVQLKPDVIVALNSISARAVRQATSTIPIVVPVMGDPVGDGLVESLARPGGNVTGLTFIAPQLVPKRLALLKEALPRASRVGALWHPGAYGERTMNDMVKETEAAARTLGLRLQLVAVRGPDEFDSAFAAVAKERADAIIEFPSPMFFNERKRIVESAARHRLPSVSVSREFTELGGLMSYGASITDLFRRASAYVDRILKGAKPGDLPVEIPTKFELVVNLRTAKTLGLTIPRSVILRADEVIE